MSRSRRSRRQTRDCDRQPPNGWRSQRDSSDSDGRYDRHAWTEEHVRLVIEHDLDGHALDDLDVVAGCVFSRQQCEGRAAAALNAIDMAPEVATGIGVDADRYGLTGPTVGQWGF